MTAVRDRVEVDLQRLLVLPHLPTMGRLLGEISVLLFDWLDGQHLLIGLRAGPRLVVDMNRCSIVFANVDYIRVVEIPMQLHTCRGLLPISFFLLLLFVLVVLLSVANQKIEVLCQAPGLIHRSLLVVAAAPALHPLLYTTLGHLTLVQRRVASTHEVVGHRRLVSTLALRFYDSFKVLLIHDRQLLGAVSGRFLR